MTLGHLQRGGAPNAWDRQLCTRYGVAAVEAVANGEVGTMIALRGGSILPVPLSQGVGRIRTVPVDGELVQSARAIGISFGDEPAPALSVWPALPSAHGGARGPQDQGPGG